MGRGKGRIGSTKFVYPIGSKSDRLSICDAYSAVVEIGKKKREEEKRKEDLEQLVYNLETLTRLGNALKKKMKGEQNYGKNPKVYEI